MEGNMRVPDMSGPEKMRLVVADEVRKTKEEMLEAGPDSTRRVLGMYRSILENEGMDVATLTGEELIEKMALWNAQKGMLN